MRRRPYHNTDTDPYDFGNVTVGATATRTFTLQNTGAVAATAVGGSGLVAPFSFLGGSYPGTGGTCGATINASANCTVVVEFAPTSAIASNDTMDIDYNNGVGAQTSSRQVTGTGIAPALLTIDSGPTYNYGLIANGGVADRTFTVTNSGASAATAISEIGLAAPFAFLGGGYPGTGGTCGLTIAAVLIYYACGALLATGGVAHSDTIRLQYNNGAVTGLATRPGLVRRVLSAAPYF